MAALRRLSALRVRVLRDGSELVVEARELVPGDTVHFHVKLSNKRPPVWKYWAEAMVDGKKVADTWGSSEGEVAPHVELTGKPQEVKIEFRGPARRAGQ